MNFITRALLSILLLAALICAALWIFGGKKAQYTTSLTIDAPAEVVFPYLTHGDKLKEWVTGLSDYNSSYESLNEVGAQMTVVYREGDRQFKYDDRVLRYEENEFLSIQSTNNVISTTSVYELTENGNKTRLDLTLKQSRMGFGRVLAIFSKDDVQNRIEQDTQRLKNLVETSYSDDQ